MSFFTHYRVGLKYLDKIQSSITFLCIELFWWFHHWFEAQGFLDKNINFFFTQGASLMPWKHQNKTTAKSVFSSKNTFHITIVTFMHVFLPCKCQKINSLTRFSQPTIKFWFWHHFSWFSLLVWDELLKVLIDDLDFWMFLTVLHLYLTSFEFC